MKNGAAKPAASVAQEKNMKNKQTEGISFKIRWIPPEWQKSTNELKGRNLTPENRESN
jgi:hypothetical protein